MLHPALLSGQMLKVSLRNQTRILKLKIRAGQSSYWTKIHRIERIIVGQFLTRETSQRGKASSINETQNVVIRHLLTETDASGTKDTAFIVKGYARPEARALGLYVLALLVTAVTPAIVRGEFLQPAFPGLIANRTIQGMIDQQEIPLCPPGNRSPFSDSVLTCIPGETFVPQPMTGLEPNRF